jgi:hypothetical protein
MGIVYASSIVVFYLYLVCYINIGAKIKVQKSFKDKTKTISEYIRRNLNNIIEASKSRISRLIAILQLIILLIIFHLAAPFLFK